MASRLRQLHSAAAKVLTKLNITKLNITKLSRGAAAPVANRRSARPASADWALHKSPRQSLTRVEYVDAAKLTSDGTHLGGRLRATSQATDVGAPTLDAAWPGFLDRCVSVRAVAFNSEFSSI